MSKAIQTLNQEKKIFSIIEPILQKTIERQDEQGNALRSMFEGVRTMYGEFQEGISEMKQMVQEVRDSVTLNNAECAQIHSAVAAKSIKLTKDRYNEEEGETFKAVVGSYRRMIWKKLKEKYDVPRYNCIRRIDFQDAYQFVGDFRPEDYI